ncbi:DUF4197 domain-containing protein [Mucilaginibacter sp. UR6-11]|uniref:DUF4197 domain-containing protein n=1 Tax=Mucilaginibacter sp. UR6-11 TaxID=1435644 RepID=UPI001E50E797|nr:DUF4197 domain-containing protein [Mucilaginibacter sp. UR6-11]MCC8424984.1 DUF4197 domain-containing protein [Mucilaginibacter sp. UR6-11]
MKKSLLLLPLLVVGLALSGYAQIIPSSLEIGTALKQALQQGTIKSADQLSAVNGFFGNAAVKILLPPEAQKAERTLRSMGMGKVCDNAILSLNRAAEDAAAQAKPIFISAIKKMTLQDVTNILLGSQDAATQYFRRSTTGELTEKFQPVIQASLNKANATRYYTILANTYNKVPFVRRINPDIANYATLKAIDGLFIEIATQELSIRQNLGGSRSTPLLKKVFDFADKNIRY